MQREFAKGGEDLFGLLYLQMKGSIDSWAIRWCYQQFIENKLTVYPQKSKIINNGMDDSGTHCKDNKFNKRYKTKAIEYKTEFEQVFIDSILVKEFADLYKLPWYVKIKRKVMKMLGLW